MTEQSRIEFEAWATENGMGLHLDRSESGLYVSPVTQKFVGCWVAAQAKQTAEVEALRKSLLEASEEVATWGAYASEYFQEKHDLAGCVARFNDAAMSKEAGHD